MTTTMTKDRLEIFEALRAIEEQPAELAELEAELRELREQIEVIEKGELAELRQQADELGRQVYATHYARNQQRKNLLWELEKSEPAEVRKVRDHVQRAFDSFRLTTPGEGPAPRWRSRADAFAAARKILSDLWKFEDWQDRLDNLIKEHGAALPELTGGGNHV